jgi:hypothetical protein
MKSACICSHFFLFLNYDFRLHDWINTAVGSAVIADFIINLL